MIADPDALVDPAGAGSGAIAIRIEDLTVRYGTFAAVDGLGLTVPQSAITTILGPNGAGKTTTLEVCEGLRRRSSGRVEVLGLDPWRASAEHRARIGVLLQRAGLPSGMRAVEAIRSAADLYADPYPVDELVERLRLGDVGRRPFRRLSGGEQQRVGLAVALVGRPHLLLLDEPTSGMDPATRKETWDLLTELAVAGTTVVVTTHQIDEAEAVADHVVLIAAGRTVAEGRPHALSGDAPTVRFEAAPGLPIATLTAGVAREDSPGRYVVVGARGRADADLMAAVLAWCGTNSVVPSQLTAGRPSLESAVLDLVDWTATR